MPELAEINGARLAAALVHVESLPLGEAVIVHNRESGAMIATNAFGAMLIDHLRKVVDVAAATRSLASALDLPVADLHDPVAQTVAQWAADGLFLTALRPFPGTLPYRPVQGGMTRHFELGTRTVSLRSEDSALVADLDRALAPMGLAAHEAVDEAQASTDGPPIRLEVVGHEDGYAVFRDGSPVWGVAGYELSRFHLLREIMDGLCGPERVSAHLHASAVSLGGAGLVFAGASGSGKSTLATLLLGTGAALAADDHVALDISGDALFAFPTRPNLKPGTAEIASVRAVIAARAEGPGAFVPKARVRAGTALQLAGLVFPRYAPDADNALTELAPDEALRALIQTGSRVSRSTRSIVPFVHALGTYPTCRLSYRDTDFAIAECLKLFDRRTLPGR